MLVTCQAELLHLSAERYVKQALVISAMFTQPSEEIGYLCPIHGVEEMGTWHEPMSFAQIAKHDPLITSPN
jgi:hypothetical protein